MTIPTASEQRLPLEGVVVLDLTRALAGPFATLILAQLGATVIKIEGPNAPDMARANAPFIGPEGVRLTRENGEYISVGSLNRLRGKLSVSLDLHHPDAAEIWAKLVKSAHMVVENFSAGTADRLGVGYEVTREVNPAIVYCSLSGFAPDDPANAGVPAMDAMIQALSGAMLTSGSEGEPPVRIGMPIADTVSPLYLVVGALAALRVAESTGVGQHITVSMLGSMTSLLSIEPWETMERLGIPARTGPRLQRLSPWGLFRTADGWVTLIAALDKWMGALAAAIGQPDLIEDPRFSSRDARVANHIELETIIEAWTSQAPTEVVLAALRASGVPCADVRTPADAVAAPEVLRRGETVRLTHPAYPEGDQIIGTGLPIGFSASPLPSLERYADLGADTAEVLARFGGLTPEEIRELADAGAI